MTRTIQIPILILLVVGTTALNQATTSVGTFAQTYNNGEAQKSGAAFAYSDPTKQFATGDLNGQVSSDNNGWAVAKGSTEAQAVANVDGAIVKTQEHLETHNSGQAAGAASGQALSNLNTDQAQSNSNVYANQNAFAQESALAVSAH